MRRLITLTTIALAAAVGLIAALSLGQAQADGQTNESILVLVDVSGSMDLPSDTDPSKSRLEVAQDSLTEAFNEIEPGSIDVGLRTFTAEAFASCGDLGSLVVPVGPADPDALVTAVEGLETRGGTPTPEALRTAVADLPATGERTIILISDGQSTCGDPCVTATEIIAEGIDVTIHTIGFQTEGSAAEPELACVAAATGGKAISAAEPDELTKIIDRLIGPKLPPVTVTFTLSQVFLCSEETGPSSSTCNGGGDPLGGADIAAEISFDDRTAIRLEGDRDEDGDFDNGRFKVATETFAPSGEVVPITIKVFDKDFGADDQIDVSPIDNKLIATVQFNTADGTWTIDGDSTPNRHFVRGDGDSEHGNDGHPALLTFDISPLLPGTNINATFGDVDGDGLLDGWERHGLTLVDMTQPNPVTSTNLALVEVLNPSWGADVNAVDMFIENDWLAGSPPLYNRGISGFGYEDIVDAFANAPTPINVRFDTGTLGVGTDLGGGNEVNLASGVTVCSVGSSDFYDVKATHFDLNRRWIFRYALNGSSSAQGGCGRGGQAEIGGNDILNLRGDAVVMMHELGHSLGLRHGGDSNEHCKPNYMSVMNYTYDRGRGITVAGGGYLMDFSPARIPGTADRMTNRLPRNEGNLVETEFALSNPDVIFEFFNGTALDTARGGVVPDFNGDGDTPDVGISVNLSANPAIDACKDDTDIETLVDHDDWSAISVAFRKFGDANDAAITPSDDDDLATDEEAEQQQLSSGRADLEISVATGTSTGSALPVAATVRSLDRRLANAPVIEIVVPSGATLSGLPATCTSNGAVTTCPVAAVLESLDGTLPTPGATLDFAVTGTSGDVVLTATSESNPVTNDPNPANNVATISLSEVQAIDDEVTVTAPNDALIPVLNNDMVNGPLTSLTVVSDPAQATATVEGDQIRYTPGVSTSTTDTFMYEACTAAACDTATVTITIIPPTCRRRALAPLTATIWGTNGADEITGTDADDVIVGFGGNDLIHGAGGANTICAGAGNDEITSDGSIDYIRGGSGDDVIFAGRGIDRLWGDSGDDTIYGEGGSDRIRGGLGNDTVHAGSGADRVWGGPGNDVIFGMGGQDFVWAGDGNDTVQGNFQSDRLRGGPGNDEIRGAGGKDKLYGDEGDDQLFGGTNTDYLEGGDGNDVADGQAGRDNPLVVDESGCDAETTISC